MSRGPARRRVPGGIHEWAEVVEVHFFRPTGPAPDLKMSFTTAHRARRSAVRRQIVEYLRSAAFRISSRLKKYVLNAPGSAGTTLGPPFSRQNHQKSPRTVHTLARGAKRNRPDGAVGSAGGSCGSPGHVPLVCDTRGPAEPSPSRLAGSHSKGRVPEVEYRDDFFHPRDSYARVCALRYLARGLVGKSSGC